MNNCKVENCLSKYHAKGYCEKHYRYAKSHNGNPCRPIGGIDVHGYHRVKINGIIYRTHRLIVEKELGRKLLKTEIIHHIDGNKLNNNFDNLLICRSDKEHMKYHHKQFVINGNKQCTKCKQWFSVENNFSFCKSENRWNRWCKKCQKGYDQLRYLRTKKAQF